MSASIRTRLKAIERAMGVSDSKLAGVIDLLPGQAPIDALAGAGVGYWFISDVVTDEGFLGEVRRDGTREVHYAPA